MLARSPPPQAPQPCTLGEGAVIERLRRQPDTPLDPFLANSAFVYEPALRTALGAIYRQYLQAAQAPPLPLLLPPPTWREKAENIAAAGLAGRPVNAENVHLPQSLRAEAG